MPDGSADLVVANAMLHWLNQPKLGNTPERALREMYRILKPGGLVFLCTPAIEAHCFRLAYQAIVARHAQESYFDEKLYCEDPLGSMQLFELVEFLKAASFKIEVAMTLYQTQQYSSAAEYASSVRAYGYHAYMAPFAAEVREDIWAETVKAFERSMGPGLYMHEIYQNNLVARQPR
jgi:SAM-dependent methyltransferase